MLISGRNLLAALLLTLLSVTTAAAVDPFYERLQRQGAQATNLGNSVYAVKLLRLACFGMLEEPPELAVCLTYLATAQAEAGDEESFATTFGRLLEIEQRFRAYSQSDLPLRPRNRLEDHLERLVSQELLMSTGAFRHIASRQMTVEAAEETTAVAPDGDDSAGDDSAGDDSAGDDSAGDDSALQEPTLSDEESNVVENARQVIGSGSLDVLIAAFNSVRRIAEEHPEEGALQHLAGELAYRVKLWREACVYFESGGAIERSDLRFYYAVALYETGDVEKAAAVLRDGLPGLKESDFSRDYVQLILGAAGKD